MQNPYIMAWFEPIKKETPEMTEDEFIALLDDVLCDACETLTADLEDNLSSDPVNITAINVMTATNEENEEEETNEENEEEETDEETEEETEEDETEEDEPEPHLLTLNADEPATVYEYITIQAEKYGSPEKQTIIKYDNLANLAECDILGLKMLRNTADTKTMNGKTAQHKILTHKQTNNMVLARIYKKYEKDKEFRTWGQCTPNMALNLIKNNNSLYEIVDQYPHKIYFDIDQPYIIGGSLNINDYLPSYVSKINNIFKNADLAISGDISTTKISFHIVIDNYLIRDEDEKKQLIHIANFIGADNSVYNTNKLIKMLNQAKPPPDHTRTQKPIGIIGDRMQSRDDPKKHIITAFFNEKTAYRLPNWKRTIENVKNESPEIVELKLKLYGQTLAKPFDMADMPKRILNLDLMDFDIYKATAEQLLEITTLNEDKNGHEYTSKYGLFAYHHIKSESMGFDEFIKWRLANKRIKQGETKEQLITRWQKWWQTIPPQKTTDGNFKYKSMSVENLRWALLQNNPELHRDKFLNNFLTMFNDSNFMDCDRLTVDRLDRIHYDHNNRKYVIANIGMCGGKTAQTAKYLLENKDKQFMWIVNKIALAQNTCERLRAEGLKICNYKQRRETKKAELNDSNNLLVCLNSLHLAESFKLIDQNKIIVIDEIETFLITWHDNATLNNHRVDKGHLWGLLIQLLRRAEKVIFLDAFISSHTMEFIKMLESDHIPLLIRRPSETTSRKVQFLNKYDKWLGDILDDLAEGKKLFIFYPYYNRQTKPISLPSMEELQRFLIEETKKRGREIDGKYYHGQIDQVRTNELYNVGETWDKIQFVICNTKITVGVSYEGANTFDRCYILALGWVEPRDIIQVSYRARTLNDDLIKICLLSTFNMNVNYKCDEHNLESICNRIENNFCPIYRNLVKNSLNEKWSPYEQKLLSFIKFAGYTIIDGETAINPILQENLRKFLEGQEIKHLYHSIRLIQIEDEEKNEIALIKKKLYNNEATEIDQIEYKKWEFDSFFKHHTDILLGAGAEDEETGEYIPDTMSNEKLERYKGIIWDKKYFKTMDYMRYILTITTDRNYKIFNEFKNMFNGSYIPTAEQLSEIMRKKIKLNENLLDLIFVDKFRTITRKSSTIHIIKHIYNTTFGKKLISVSQVRHLPKIDEDLASIIDILPLILCLPEVKINNVEGKSDQTEPKQFINYDEEEATTTDEDF